MMFDFFGLGQQVLAPQQQDNNSIWGHNGGGEHVGQNEMDFDLNMEVVIEGDEQALLM
jgi:hypothetical protein